MLRDRHRRVNYNAQVLGPVFPSITVAGSFDWLEIGLPVNYLSGCDVSNDENKF